MEIVVSLLSGSLGAGVVSIIMAALQRHWRKKDDKDGSIKALVKAQKVLMINHVRDLGEKYIQNRKISLEDKETIHEMYDAYKALGGNGHLETVMQEIDRLPIATTKED